MIIYLKVCKHLPLLRNSFLVTQYEFNLFCMSTWGSVGFVSEPNVLKTAINGTPKWISHSNPFRVLPFCVTQKGPNTKSIILEMPIMVWNQTRCLFASMRALLVLGACGEPIGKNDGNTLEIKRKCCHFPLPRKLLLTESKALIMQDKSAHAVDSLCTNK